MTNERTMAVQAKRFTSKGRAFARFIAQHALLIPVAWSTVRVKVEGVGNLKDVGKSFIVIANHSSHLDAPLIIGSLPLRMSRYLAAAAAADYFFAVWWRRSLTGLFFNAFPVDRHGMNSRVVSAKTLIEGGVPLLVFPEGTRSKDYRRLGRFTAGAAALSLSTGVPCIPVALVGAGRAHPRGGKWPKPGRPRVGVVYGEPMMAQPGEVASAFMARIKAEIERLLDEHGPRILGDDHTPQRRQQMTDVAHMKWWGWGREGVGFHWEDKPAFPQFVLDAVGLDLHAAQPVPEPSFGDLQIPKSRTSASLSAALAGIVGEDDVTTDDLERVVHTYGKSLRDLVRIRANRIERLPDLVVYPDDEAEVQRIVDAVVAADAVLIPFGGGSNIAGSLEPHADESRIVVSVDLGRLRRVLSIDAESGTARIQAGALGPDLEAQLNAKGMTIGHFPDSFTHSSVGGWVATRSSGMQSDKYGDIADIALGMRVARPGGTMVIRALPSTSSGPSVREMVLGSEGRLGVITEVTVQVHRQPAKRDVYAYFFPNWKAGIAAMRAIAESDATPSITRVSDARETGFSLATSKESKGMSKFLSGTVLPTLMKRKGWDKQPGGIEGNLCLSFIGYEGSVEHAKRQKSIVDKIVKKHGGLGVGTGPGVLYDQKKFDTPYLRDFLLDRGAAGDVSETAGPWSKLLALHDGAYAAANAAYEKIGRKGWIMSHLSHSYHSGACLYFTFAFVGGDDMLAEYDIVKSAIQQSFIDNGGTLSHHHGVGLEHAPWLEQDISPAGARVVSGLFAATDPGSNLNPRKIVVDAIDTAAPGRIAEESIPLEPSRSERLG